VAIDRAAVLRNGEKLLRQGKLDAALAEYVRVVEDQPNDWNVANTLGDLYMRAGQTDKAVEQFARIADSLGRDGFLQKAAALYKKILKIRPDDEHALLQAGEIAVRQGVLVDARTYLNAVAERRSARGDEAGAAAARGRLFEVYLAAGDLERARELAVAPEQREALGRAFADRGDMTSAAQFLTLSANDFDPELLLALARSKLQEGSVGDGLSMLRQLLNQDASRAEAISTIAWTLAEQAPDAALQVVEVVAETAIIEADWARAAGWFQEFAAQVPNHVPALLRLVEICFDGGLETAMYTAQSRLADAYLAAGSAVEARVVAEDLMAREPEEPQHVEQLRRALLLLGERDPDRMIAERTGRGLGDFDAPDPLSVADSPEPERDIAERVAAPASTAKAAEAPAASVAADDVVEIDLSETLSGFQVLSPPQPAPPPRDLDEVFDRIREERFREVPDGRPHYDRGVELRDSGRIDESIDPFMAASRDPRWRFQASRALAGVYRQRQEPQQAIEWLERAAQSLPPDAADSHALLYELAEALEAQGESERALAVCLELQADAGDYRDVAGRIKRLTGVQA